MTKQSQLRGIKNSLEDAFLNYENPHKLTKKEFKEICETFNHCLMEAVINTGYIYKLPRKLGTVSIIKEKARKQGYIDFAHFNKTGEVIRHKNRHSDGYFAKFFWAKSSPYCLVANKMFYKFKPLRFYKRKLARSIIDNNTITKYFWRE
tara:strand:+ start:2333 stop:2779 length:447 start_codon:yes stop_codon:yes gene_type:complete